MKSLLTILLIAVLMGGAVVGFLTMDRHGDCVASRAIGAVCSQSNVLAYIGMHADFLRSFSEAFLVMILAISSGLIFLVFFRLSGVDFNLGKKFFVNKIRAINITNKRKLIYWLSLFETSPTVSLAQI